MGWAGKAGGFGKLKNRGEIEVKDFCDGENRCEPDGAEVRAVAALSDDPWTSVSGCICYRLDACDKANGRQNGLMTAIEVIGDIDEQHRLRAQVPHSLPAGPVRLMVFLPDPQLRFF